MYRFPTLMAMAGALAGAMAASATAQLAPPPPPPVEKPPVVYPPPPPPPRPAQAAPRARGMPAPPNFEFKKLAEFDAEGNLEPMRQSPEYLAVVRNPKIEPGQIPAVQEAMDIHYGRVDDMVIDNVDLVMEAAGGVFDDANLNNPEQFNNIQGIMNVLMTARGLPERLKQENAIDDEQLSATRAIYADWVQTFNKEALDKAVEKHGEDNRGAVAVEMGRAMFHLLSMEAMLAHRRMALRIADDFGAVIEAAELAGAEGVADAREAIAAAESDDERYQAVVDFMLELGFREQQALLNANRERAPKRDYPELDEIGKRD
jgi:hypothetical protein